MQHPQPKERACRGEGDSGHVVAEAQRDAGKHEKSGDEGGTNVGNVRPHVVAQELLALGMLLYGQSRAGGAEPARSNLKVPPVELAASADAGTVRPKLGLEARNALGQRAPGLTPDR